MPSIKQQGQMDGNMASLSEKEVAGAFEEPVTIQRWQSASGGDPADGVAPTDTYLAIRTTANIEGLNAKDVYFPGSIYVPGDLRAAFRLQVFGAEAQTGDGLIPGRKPDQAIYRQRTYYFVGHVDRKKLNERWYWVGILRQVGS